MADYRLILTTPDTVVAEFDAQDDKAAITVGMERAKVEQRNRGVSRGRDFQVQRAESGNWVMVLGWTGATGA